MGVPKTVDLTADRNSQATKDRNSQVAKADPTGTEIAKHLHKLILSDVDTQYYESRLGKYLFLLLTGARSQKCGTVGIPRHVWNDNTTDKVRALGLQTIALGESSK